MAGTRPRVLVVEDDRTVAEVVARYLDREGFDVEAVHDGSVALARVREWQPDLVLLDLMLPGMDGLDVCRRLRARVSVPIIMLTARGEEEDRVAGLELGADDYVTKPFSTRELTARVKSVLRRTNGTTARPTGDEPLRAADLELSLDSRQLSRNGRPVKLTLREFELLAFLMLHPQQVYRREELLERVWGYTFGDLSTVTVHVRRLREKIEDDPGSPQRLKTVWGVGYRFDP